MSHISIPLDEYLHLIKYVNIGVEAVRRGYFPENGSTPIVVEKVSRKRDHDTANHRRFAVHSARFKASKKSAFVPSHQLPIIKFKPLEQEKDLDEELVLERKKHKIRRLSPRGKSIKAVSEMSRIRADEIKWAMIAKKNA